MHANLFSILSIPQSFDINLQTLESAYFAAQRQHHPDRFIGKPDAERLKALQQSADINKAYETLKSPLKRAQYLLHLKGITVGTEQDSVKPSPALLTEIMELRERIAETPKDKLGELNDSLDKMIQRSIKILGNNYMYAQWNEMAQETLRLGYIVKAIEELRRKK
jgi:molecular chaperone HscB